MMKFFRKIRQKLLQDNHFSKYLLYAIGEIALVVIGIVIALQINNWNENRKIRKLELTLLKELNENLESDIHDMNFNRGFHERGVLSANIILFSFENNFPQNDSLNKHYGKVSLIPMFLRTETAYNSFQANGMRIIKNDSLRIIITQYYEEKTQFLKDYIDAEWNVQFQDSRDISRKFFKKFEVFSDLIPEDYTDLSMSQEYKNYLNNRIGWSNVTVSLYESNIQDAESLIEAIKSELDNRNVKE